MFFTKFLQIFTMFFTKFLQIFVKLFDTTQMFETEKMNETTITGGRKFITGNQMPFSKSNNRERIKLLNNHKMNTYKMPVSRTFLRARAKAFGHSVSDQY